MAKGPFYIGPFTWKADQKKGRTPDLQDVYELPPAIARLDKRVKGQLCKLLASEKSSSLRAALKRSVKELETHRDMGWGLTFRATYMSAWCHELAWFAMAPDSGPTLVTVRTPFKRCCHVCGGGDGFKKPTSGFGRKSPGDLLETPPIPEGLQKAVAAVLQEVGSLRASGVLDPIMKEVARTMGRLGRQVNAYLMFPVVDFDIQGERAAISTGNWLAPGHLPGPEPEPKYYKPCSWCRGSGAEY